MFIFVSTCALLYVNADMIIRMNVLLTVMVICCFRDVSFYSDMSLLLL